MKWRNCTSAKSKLKKLNRSTSNPGLWNSMLTMICRRSKVISIQRLFRASFEMIWNWLSIRMKNFRILKTRTRTISCGNSTATALTRRNLRHEAMAAAQTSNTQSPRQTAEIIAIQILQQNATHQTPKNHPLDTTQTQTKRDSSTPISIPSTTPYKQKH